ncbi:MAG: hypothetical protein GYA55_02845 [SAR324 cluster bacterium]|uniref:Uncharacterized protein n=1 Tax=SAR324 cluster bacterium TaxID=2024889 RepID=A0A7X9III2_9DELT|nr:hypothetical protein [SAR324 cluster bacterium]
MTIKKLGFVFLFAVLCVTVAVAAQKKAEDSYPTDCNKIVDRLDRIACERGNECAWMKANCDSLGGTLGCCEGNANPNLCNKQCEACWPYFNNPSYPYNPLCRPVVPASTPTTASYE